MAFVTIKDKDDVTLGYLQTDAQERLGVHNLLHVQDQKPSGTAGGTFASGAWRTRDLNTVVKNNIVGAGLSNNRITLKAGGYFCQAYAYSYVSGRTQARIFNIAGVVIALGVSNHNPHAINSPVPLTYFSINTESTIELQHRCETSTTNQGFGVAHNFDTLNIYSDIKIWKLS